MRPFVREWGGGAEEARGGKRRRRRKRTQKVLRFSFCSTVFLPAASSPLVSCCCVFALFAICFPFFLVVITFSILHIIFYDKILNQKNEKRCCCRCF